jgi:hypothetical protein
MAVSIPVRPIVSTTNHVGVISGVTIGSASLQSPATLRGACAEDCARPNRDFIPILLPIKHPWADDPSRASGDEVIMSAKLKFGSVRIALFCIGVAVTINNASAPLGRGVRL